MINYLFGVKDTVSNEMLFIGMSKNASCYLRSTLPVIYAHYPIRDLVCYELASVDSNTGIIIDAYDDPKEVDWSCYSFPETESDNLASLGVDPAKVFFDKNKDILNK